MPVLKIDSDLDSYLQRISCIEQFPSATAILDPTGELVYENRAFAELNRQLRDSDKHLYNRQTLLECPDLNSWLTSTLQAADSQQLNSTFFYAKNIRVELSLLSTPIHGPNNQLLGRLLSIGEESVAFNNRYLARLQDTNLELKNRIISLDQERNKSDKLIRILLRNAPFAMLIFNEHQQIIHTNSMAERLFGLTASQMTGKHCSNFIDCYQCNENCKALCGQTDSETNELIYLSAQKEIALLRSIEVLNDNNETLIIEAFVDVTTIRKAEDEIKRLNELNTLLVNSTGEGIFSMDNDLKCTFINKAACDMLGYQPEDIVGQGIEIFFSNSEDSGSHALRDPENGNFIHSSGIKHIDATFTDRSGQPLPVQYLCSPIHKDMETQGAVIVFRDVSEARLTAKKLDYMATHDMLTGLLNRYAFEVKLSHLLEEREISSASHILCYIDLDQFKIINDSSGHAAGDALLKQVGNIIYQKIRKSDALSRLGGDEFGVLLIDCQLNKAIDIMTSILNEIIDFRFPWDEKIFTVGASIGLVELQDSMKDVSSAMQAADSACYIAKKNGRRRIHIYVHNDDNIKQQQFDLTWVNRIKESLQTSSFSLWQQPIVAIDAGNDKQHLEILIRMHNENNELVLPGSFIPTAERYNLMTEIDKWVITETIQHLSVARLENIEHWCINISGQSISDDLFISFIHDAFNDYRHLTRYVCFEITETAAISNLSKASRFMEEIKNMGFTFSLDDFGSGMSSFAYLKNLPVDYLKIDGNFIRNIENDSIDLAMVEAIHRIGKVMGIRTIAEFVENHAIVNILKTIGIDYVQGYAIGKPSPLVKEHSGKHIN